MKLPQIIRFADYLQDQPAEAVRTVLHQDPHDNMVLWQIPPQTMLPAHRHPHGADIWIVLQGEAELVDDAQSGRTIRAGEAVVVGDHQIHGARNNGQPGDPDCILVSVISPKAGFEQA
ncbi:cupin domain-containing protein [Eikenella sp. S3360]|uniref:Cupin domain-containing protein n=1 Tax=Eikenella glucosivorans TaxID=2766967 RepID=A0ABS0N822_9NEIS|nr:cupin domain-containing protein [Eikenella glucosivorans]MBH5328463.1 cupin domain-containing protein [Eikenella glucosivorans]